MATAMEVGTVEDLSIRESKNVVMAAPAARLVLRHVKKMHPDGSTYDG